MTPVARQFRPGLERAVSTWVEIAESVARPANTGTSRRESSAVGFPKLGIGRGSHSFAQRLSRARLLYARRREACFNWLALSLAMFIVLAAPSVPF